jgi:nucleoredoxin
MESFLQSFGNDLVSKNGPVDGSSLKSAQLIGIYFSAHWCPPCRGFTPVLAEFYNKVNANGEVFEVVFVSSDNDEKSFQSYLNEMPWIAVKFGAPEIEALGDQYQVSGIPRLVILKTDGTVVSSNARSDVMTKKEAAFALWLNKNEMDPQEWQQLTTSGQAVKVK